MARLSDVGKIITGNTPKTSDKLNYLSNDICFVKPSDISDGEITHIQNSEFYISDYAREKARILPTQSVLVTCIGIIGKVAINDVECAFNQQINAIVPDTSKCLTKYLAYAIQNKQKEMQDIANAPVVPILNKSQFSDIEILLPSIELQSRIVEEIGSVDDLISLRKQQLSKLDELVKSRFVELFGDPVKNDMAWKTKPLNDVCDGIGDGLHGTPVYDDNGDYPFINGNNLIDGAITITPATKMVSAETYAKHYIGISPNAILISINGTLGKLAFYNGEQVMLGKSACYCNLKPSVNKVFVYGVMSSDAFAEFLDNSSTKSTIKNVGLKAMREYKLILPPIELQDQFAAFVEQTDKSKFEIQQSLEKLETLKKSLMQKYFG